MNKFLLLPLFLTSAIGASAEVTLPDFSYYEDFKSSLNENQFLPEGWISYGIGQTVDVSYQNYFGAEGEGPFFRVFTIDGQSAAWSCSTFVYANTADEWLVTPPIHINSDSELLKIKAVSSGAFATNRYRVLISENGQDRESFRPNPILNTTLTGWETEVRSKESYIPINGYAGKDICFAFVNRSEDAGLLGFTDIAVAPYIIDVANLTPSVLTAGSDAAISLNVNVRTPSDVKGLKAELTYGDKTLTKTYEQTITQTGVRIVVNFEDVVVPEGGMEYSISLTPLFEGAQPTIVTGEIGTPTTTYPPVAVIEEFTGTWCSYCPRGAAFMNYYSDHFNGKDGKMKAIGIALHSVNDPMIMEDDSYLNYAYNISQCTGYPSAFFNRRKLGDPSDAYIVREMEDTRSNSRIKINKVDYTPGSPINVSYEVENSYSKSNMNQKVALVMVENKVKGNNPLYNQANALSGVSKQAVANTYGEELWPYFQFFAEHSNPVLFSLMTYDHVARGIWPDYFGELLNDRCEAEVPVMKDMTIDMPSQVNNPDNTAVIALLMDADSGYIISADEVEASEYNKSLSGIYNIDSDSLKLEINGTSLICESISGGYLSAVSIDGATLLETSLRQGMNSIDMSGLSGVVIIKATDNNGTINTIKHIF